jgi:hypothetical protein
MKSIIIILILFITLVLVIKNTDSDPYAEGRHFGYIITCKDGVITQNWVRRSRIYNSNPVKNSDGTLLRCGQKYY